MKGRLEVITGPMFSGKSGELVRRIKRAMIAKKTVVVLKPEIDNRYSQDAIVTHDGMQIPCIPIPVDCSFTNLIKIVSKIEEADVIAVDEAHFFGNNFPALCEKLIEMGKIVIVAGLDLDFRGQPFGPMPILLALADEVVKLTAICTRCGAEATRTQRIIGGKIAPWDSPTIVVGGAESYEPRCRKCWVTPPRNDLFCT